jgi:hypothetical protein
MDHLWILNKASSATLYYRNYSKLVIDPDLVSGLLGAFNNFSEVELSGLGIDSINMGGLQWVYLNNVGLNLLAVAAERKGAGNADLMRARLEVILNAFVTKFNLTPESMDPAKVSYVKGFREFDKDLDDLQDQWSMAETVTNAGELFDILGVFQQILNLFNMILHNNCEPETCTAIMDELKSFATRLQRLFDVQQYPEFEKITFDEQLGWNVITLDPTKLRKDVLNKALFNIIRHVKYAMINNLGTQLVMDAISQQILPYILSSWDLLEILDLTKPLVTVLLERPEE